MATSKKSKNSPTRFGTCLLRGEQTSSLAQVKALGAFDFKQRCAEWSVYDIKVPQEQ